MATRLKKMRITEISLVPRGANRGASVLIAKSDERVEKKGWTAKARAAALFARRQRSRWNRADAKKRTSALHAQLAAAGFKSKTGFKGLFGSGAHANHLNAYGSKHSLSRKHIDEGVAAGMKFSYDTRRLTAQRKERWSGKRELARAAFASENPNWNGGAGPLKGWRSF